MDPNAKAWDLVVEYFQNDRRTSKDVYPSEWFFLKTLLKENVSILDIGCAHGGFANIVSEHLKTFTYTGVDISAEMLKRAKENHPKHQFFHVREASLEALGSTTYDVVLCLGILHLNERWRELLANAWKVTQGSLLIDLRETSGESIEDKSRSYFKMDFGGKDSNDQIRLPYNILNSAKALKVIEETCTGANKLFEYGYKHPVRNSANTPLTEVMMKTYCIKR